jgi:DNA-binding SARP family transcriptional activator
MDFRALGPIEAQHDGRVLAIGGARQKALLPLLLIKSPEVVSRDALIEELWRGDPAPIEVPPDPGDLAG